MKKTYQNILIIFLFSILIMIPEMSGIYYKGHDTNFHVANISALTKQLSFSNIFAKEPLPYIAKNFGYGTRFFYPPIPHLTAAYITKALSFLGINDVSIGMRITQWLTFFLSGITFYFLAVKISKNKKIALISSFFYMTAPYHLSEVFIRDAFSEMFIPIALPLIVLGLLELLDKNYKKFFLCFVLGYTLAIYSHLAMSIYLTIILLGTFFIIYFKKIFTKKNILYLCLASFLILSLSSPFWVPLLEQKVKGSYAIFIPYYITAKGDLRFSAISPLIYLDFTKPHHYDFIRYHLQLLVTVLFLAGVIIFFKKKLWKDKNWLFILSFTIISIIMTSPLYPWYYTPDLLQTLQFPWRLCLYVAFGAILGAMLPFIKLEKKKYFNTICILCAVLSLAGAYFYTYHVDDEKVVDIKNIDYNLGMGNQEEYLPEKVVRNYDYYQNRKEEIVIQSGSGTIEIIENNVPNLTFKIENSKDLIVEFPRLFYQGYVVKKEGKTINVEESKFGFVKADIKEDGEYQLVYEGTLASHLSKIYALIIIIVIILYIVLHKHLKIMYQKFTKE